MPGLKEILENIDIPPLRECGTILNKHERLKSYYYLLETSQLGNNSETSLVTINSKLEEIEDCHSGIVKDDDPGKVFTGRMYPVFEDNIVRQNGRIIAKTRGNDIIIENDGSYVILVKGTTEELFRKKV